MRRGVELVVLCDYHKAAHWLGIYGDEEMTGTLESGMELTA
jgi:hypothetical protein